MLDKGTKTMGGTGHPSTPITADFVARWEPSYDTRKYPVDFYLNCTASARQAKSPENLKDVLLAVLHWKDGKALSFVPGEIHAKNLGPILMLNGAALAEFAQLFLTLVEATDDNLRERAAGLRKTLAVMWNSVVMPAFVLHVARPDRLPIIDQHTMRAFLYLTRARFVAKPAIRSWDLCSDYTAFFERAVVHAGFAFDFASRCCVDRALFAYGKWLEEAYPREKEKLLNKRALRDGIA